MMSADHLFLVLIFALLSSCGGGGGGGGAPGSGGTPNQFGEVAGTLIVSSKNHLEQENNNTLQNANVMTAGDTYAGNASDFDSGFASTAQTCNSAGVIHDLYRLTVSGDAVRVTLTIGNDDVDTSSGPHAGELINDLDLYLLDQSGHILDSSVGSNQLVETVVASPGNYYVGVQAYCGSSSYLLAAGSTSTSTALDRLTVPVDAEFVPGELFVKHKVSATARAFNTANRLEVLRDEGDNTEYVRIIKGPTSISALSAASGLKVGTPGHERNEAIGATLQALLKLRQDPSVDFVSPNFIRRAKFIPNDTHYHLQWDYPAIKIDQAWDIATTRGQGVIVAVIDTGILSGHPDLNGQTVPGYDFISNVASAADGDGIDSDPEDPGDGARPGESSFHGTHVSGTIAALTDNSAGIAGIAGGAKIMPLRVLGKNGGTDADIIEAIKFAARLSNASGTLPAVKADIVNMSLGGAGNNPATQTAINNARTQGVIIVAAAGNENTSQPSFPAAYNGVISVSAVGFDLKRAPYSNFGSTIDIAAPGGDTSVDRNNDGFADGILSTLKDEAANRFSYVFYQGTSMAAPHVAGVLALMRGVNPNITPLAVDQLIAGTHTSQLRITTDIGEVDRDNLYGHGLIDAKKAVQAAQALANQAPSSDSVLVTSADSLDFTSFFNLLEINVANGGGGSLNISSATVSANTPWLTVTPTSGVAPLRIDVNVNRIGLTDGIHKGSFTIVTDAQSGPSIKTIQVSIQISNLAVNGNIGEVFVLVINPDTFATVAQAVTDASQGYNYSIKGIPAGEYYVFAGTDRDGDVQGIICDIEDACGAYGPTVKIVSGSVLPDLNFNVNNAQSQPLSLLRQGAKSSGLKRLRH